MPISRTQSPSIFTRALLLLFCLLAVGVIGCQKKSNEDSKNRNEVTEKLDISGAKPRLNMTRLTYDFEAGQVVTHNQTLLAYKTDNWTIRLEPIEGSIARMYHSNRIKKLKENGSYPADVVVDEAKNLEILRYHFPATVTKTTLTGHYLVSIDNYWLSGRIIPANPEQQFDQESASRFLLSLGLQDDSSSDQ